MYGWQPTNVADKPEIADKRLFTYFSWEGHSKPGVAVRKISRVVTVRNTSGKSVMIRW